MCCLNISWEHLIHVYPWENKTVVKYSAAIVKLYRANCDRCSIASHVLQEGNARYVCGLSSYPASLWHLREEVVARSPWRPKINSDFAYMSGKGIPPLKKWQCSHKHAYHVTDELRMSSGVNYVRVCKSVWKFWKVTRARLGHSSNSNRLHFTAPPLWILTTVR